jgi:uncharacterized protein (TIGR01777 family)
MPTILISGGTGLIGKNLTGHLTDKGYKVILLSRKSLARPTNKLVTGALWDIDKQEIDSNAVSKADYIIHLAGAGIADKRWTKKRKQEIVDSRVKSGELLVKALRENPTHVKAVISASAIGWYGKDSSTLKGSEGYKETSPASEDFLGKTCKQWEESLEPVTHLNKRLVTLRTGIVLSTEGGALPEFIKALRFGIATILGDGKQVMSWIHIDDLARIYIAAIENENFTGVYNAVAPSPVSNKELVLKLAKIKKGSFFIPIHVPAFILKFVLGEMSIEVLKSATVSSDKIKSTGFTFFYPSVHAAIEELFSRSK